MSKQYEVKVDTLEQEVIALKRRMAELEERLIVLTKFPARRDIPGTRQRKNAQDYL